MGPRCCLGEARDFFPELKAARQVELKSEGSRVNRQASRAIDPIERLNGPLVDSSVSRLTVSEAN